MSNEVTGSIIIDFIDGSSITYSSSNYIWAFHKGYLMVKKTKTGDIIIIPFNNVLTFNFYEGEKYA